MAGKYHGPQKEAKRNKINRKVSAMVVYTPEIKNKLIEVFKLGGTVEEATRYVGVSRQTYYDWCEKIPGLQTETEQARIFPVIVARNIIVDNMVRNKDVNIAKWYLEKTVFRQERKHEMLQETNNNTVNIVFPEMVKERYEAERIITGEVDETDEPVLPSSTGESLSIK